MTRKQTKNNMATCSNVKQILSGAIMLRVNTWLACLILSISTNISFAKYNTAPKHSLPVLQNTQYKSLLSAIKSLPELKQFYKLIKQTNTNNMFQYNQPITVLAPTNKAFAKLPNKFWIKLQNKTNHGELSNIIRYHVITTNIINPQTQQGAKLNLSGPIIINKAQAIKIMQVDNSSIIIINKVLLPPSDWININLKNHK